MNTQKRTTPKVGKHFGVAVPLGALRTEKAIGEFGDLVLLGDFCHAAGLSLIQILPVNDSGGDSSPYSALSAFALNPVYVSIEALPEYPGNVGAARTCRDLTKAHGGDQRYNYAAVRKAKLAALLRLYREHGVAIRASGEMVRWIQENPWVAAYSVFMELKATHGERSWRDWPAKWRDLDEAGIAARWSDPALVAAHQFYAWVQMRADQQFSKAAAALRDRGIILKGDLPILMAEDSVDVWAKRDFFDLTHKAGAPPDMYSPLGQNWGFPIYRWAALAAAGYAWWVERLRCAARYYGAYRLDHILGFFRIWAIPTTETTALMGRPLPAVPITSADLEAACFPPDRIRWLSEPHVATRTIEAANHGDYLATHGLLRPLMNRIGAEELWLFKPDVHGDCDIMQAGLPPDVAAALVGEWRNRALIPLRGADGLPTGTYTPAWTYEASRAWQSLSEAEKGALLGVFAAASARQEALWETQARAILTALTAATSMIPCGEDLGVDLACLPRVLADEGILALRVVRWARKWGQKADADGVDSPYAPFAAYPPLSVVTTSVHDSSTLREWWLTEGGGADYLRCFAPPPGVTAAAYTPETARFLLTGAKSAPSALFIPPLQDLLGLTPRYTPPTPVAERINVPGTVSPTNWTYRLPVPTAELVADEELVGEIKRLSE